MSFNLKYRRFGKVCHFSHDMEIPVHNDLAITPSKMAQLVDDGIPVSSSIMSGSYTDGVSNPSWDIPIDSKRGVDIAEVWNAQRSARKNVTHNVKVSES